MLDFITIPLVTGMLTLGVYKLFELFVRKKERLTIIDKVGDKFDALMIESKFSFPIKYVNNSAFGTLKIACLLMGVGLGLLIGFFVANLSVAGYNQAGGTEWIARETVSIIYGASVLLFGGLGLVVAFVIEMRLSKGK